MRAKSRSTRGGNSRRYLDPDGGASHGRGRQSVEAAGRRPRNRTESGKEGLWPGRAILEILGVMGADDWVEITAVPGPTDHPGFTDKHGEEDMTGFNGHGDITAVTSDGEHVLEYGILRLGWGLSGFPGGLLGAGTA